MPKKNETSTNQKEKTTLASLRQPASEAAWDCHSWGQHVFFSLLLVIFQIYYNSWVTPTMDFGHMMSCGLSIPSCFLTDGGLKRSFFWWAVNRDIFLHPTNYLPPLCSAYQWFNDILCCSWRNMKTKRTWREMFTDVPPQTNTKTLRASRKLVTAARLTHCRFSIANLFRYHIGIAVFLQP